MELPSNFKQSALYAAKEIVELTQDLEYYNGRVNFTLELHRYTNDYRELIECEYDYSDEEFETLEKQFREIILKHLHKKLDKYFIIEESYEPPKFLLDFTYR